MSRRICCSRVCSVNTQQRIQQNGVANFYGPQRFGLDQLNAAIGLALLRGEPLPTDKFGKTPKVRDPFFKKLYLSATQSLLFNQYLSKRLAQGLLTTVLPGDVMMKRPRSAPFTVTDPAIEQQRFDQKEIAITGPIFGRKMIPAREVAGELEQQIFRDYSLTSAQFASFGKLLLGTRRVLTMELQEFTYQLQPPDLYLSFILPPGSYATIVLAEITRQYPMNAALEVDPEPEPE